MRFIETGPSLPTQLLEEQSQGNVIFFCGAGVSMPAGLDNFATLTGRIISALDSKDAKIALEDGQSFDRIFNLLVKEFGREEINLQVYKALNIDEPRTLKHHRDIIDLSRSMGGHPQVVTTNFDKLFERADKAARPLVPPALPDIELNQSIRGVVYLHGRLADPLKQDEVPSYIISSSDFGRAYLADAWATRFVKSLRERYTIVLLGYSAEDPPMRYLLEGLNVRDGVVYNSPIYAFTDRTSNEAEEIWIDRGVTPICYAPDASHSGLWLTISEWAKAAKSPDRWISRVLKLARSSPTKLKPYERGQVVQLVSTVRGAKAFADADPSPGAEWLCAFDPYVRFLEPRKRSWKPDSEEIDPILLYGLDDDPVRLPQTENQLVPDGARNALAWQKGDGFQPEYTSLRGWSSNWHHTLPNRLHHLARWFASRCHEPAAIWWAAGCRHLHPQLHWLISNRVRDRHSGEMHSTPSLIWSLGLEAIENSRDNDQIDRWFNFEAMLKNVGWTPSTLRYFDRCMTPHVQMSRPALSIPRPPLGDWSKFAVRDVVDLKVVSMDRHGQALVIPAKVLPQVAKIMRTSLERISELLDETGDHFWRPPSLIPESNDNKFLGKKASNFIWFKSVFSELMRSDIGQARTEFLSWPVNESRMFPKLRLWAAANADLVSAAELISIFKSLPQQVLWNTYNQREVLHLLRSRWGDLSTRQRRTVEVLLQKGPARWKNEKRDEFIMRRAAYSASNLRWLILQGCQLTTAGLYALENLKRMNPKWNDSWAESADESFESRGGYVQEIRDPGDLSTLPIAQIAATATRRTTMPFKELRSYHPFRGLVQAHPFKALASLRVAYREGQFPIELWIDILSEWPEANNSRLNYLLACSLSRLSQGHFLELRYYALFWLQRHINSLDAHSRPMTLGIFDKFVRHFISADPGASSSSRGSLTVGGIEQPRSEVSFGKAINSPIGKMTEALWELMPGEATRSSKMDEELACRFERLASVPGYGSGHAVGVLTQKLGWIAYCYPEWVNSFLIPMFDTGHPLAEAAWHGLAHDRNLLPAQFLKKLKSPLLKILKGEMSWSLDPQELDAFASWLVWLSRPLGDEQPLLSFVEVREVLSFVSNELRGRVLWTLGNHLDQRGDWEEFVKPFIQHGWPRQLRYRSDESTQGFVFVAEHAGSYFPDVVQTIFSLIRPIPNADSFIYAILHDRDEKQSIAINYPRAAIQLLNRIIPDDRAKRPFALAKILEDILKNDPGIRETAEYKRLRELL